MDQKRDCGDSQRMIQNSLSTFAEIHKRCRQNVHNPQTLKTHGRSNFMKNMYLLYGIAIIAVVGIFVCSISSSIVPTLMDTPQQSAYTSKSKQALKKKACACCDEKQKRMREMMREWLNEKPQENSSNKEVSATDAAPER